jgi:phenylalanyl-tRNA synthetase beta chain
MKFTLSWLKKFLDTNSSVEEISSVLNKIGFEVEEITDRSKELEAFEVARIIEAKPHPNADKLQVCTVKTKNGNLQIVCGAHNARKNLNVVLASVGTTIPNGNFVIKQAKIRDVESNGMLCSAEELLMEKESSGIIELPEEAVIGENFAKYFGLDDPVIEIDVTPNRGDALGVLGIARELAASGIGTLKKLDFPSTNHDKSNIVIDYTQACSAFASIEVQNITNKQSPLWLQNLLKNIGCTPISAVVDITNYICYSYGRPMHAYDADKLSGNLRVTKAKAQEEFHALNDKKYELTTNDVVIRDDVGIESLGGIIGGMNSACSENTQNILLEAAIFDKDLIASTGRKLAIETDARFRLERSTDSAILLPATATAANMVIDICGGEIGKLCLSGSVEFTPNKIELNEQDITKATGLNMSIKDAGNILEKLGFTVEYSGDKLEASNPSWRHDISIKEDLIEEVVRIYGFDKIPAIAISTDLQFRLAPSSFVRGNTARRVLASKGYNELITWSFINIEFAKLFSDLQDKLKLKNPMSQELAYMRPSILPNLLETIAKNATRSIASGALFEVGPVFLGTAPEDEKLHSTGVKWGNIEANIHSGNREVDIFDIKADIELLLLELGLSLENMQLESNNLPNYYHPSRSSSIMQGKNIIGYFGEIHPLILKKYEIEKRVAAFEINISSFPAPRLKAGKKDMFIPSIYQAVTRDFAFLIDRDTPAGKISKYISVLDKKLIKNVEIFDLYIGDKIDAGKKSIAIRVHIQADDHTLSDQEITSIQQNIIQGVEKEFSATLRK